LLLYYITDRVSLGNDEAQCQRRLLQKIAEAANQGVDFIQLREKDLSGKELESLAREAAAVIKTSSQGATTGPRTKFLINSRTDVALATSADGVHLTSYDISPRNVRKIYSRAGLTRAAQSRPPILSIACHSQEEVAVAAQERADFALFSPVFGKQTLGKQSSPHAPAGLKALEQACREDIPVIALGGITLENAPDCARAGAAGIAAIRLFQENDVGEVVTKLRSL